MAELGMVAVVAAALMAVVYWPVLDPDQGDVVGKYDVYRQFGPWNYYFDRALADGDFPEWNPLVFSGAPHAANPQSWSYYPPNLLRAWLHRAPTPVGTLRGLSALMALHLLAWALGTYQLARAHGFTRSAALASSLIATFSALMVRRVCEWHFLFSMAPLPWMLLLIRALSQDAIAPGPSARPRVRYALGLGILFAFSVLGGFLQILPHMVVAMAAYLIVEVSLYVRSQPDRAPRPALQLSGLLVLAAMTALGLSAALLVPGAELLGFSPRAAGSGIDVGGHTPEAWDLPYAVRSLLVYSGRRYEPETLRGAGVIALALAFSGLSVRPLRKALPFAVMVYVLVDLMLGRPWPLSTVVSWLSPAQLVSGTRAFDVAMLPVALLSGLGLDVLRERGRIASALALVVASAGAWLVRSKLEAHDIWVQPDASVWCIPALFALAMLASLIFDAQRKRWLAPGVLLLLAAELVTWNRFYAPQLLVHRGFDLDWKARDGFAGGAPLWPDNRRETTDRENFSLFSLRGVSNGYDPLHLRAYREAVSGNPKVRYRRRLPERDTTEKSPRGHLFLKRAFWLVPSVVQGQMPLGGELFAPTEAAFVTGRVPEGFPVRTRAEVLGRAHSPHTREVALSVARRWAPAGSSSWIADAGELARRHHVLVAQLEPGIDNRLEVSAQYREHGGKRWVPGFKHVVKARAGQPLTLHFPLPDMHRPTVRLHLVQKAQGPLPELASLRLLADEGDEDARIAIEHRSADRVEVTVRELSGPRLLAFVDVDYPGWRAFVDGKPHAHVRVNDVFKGVWLSPGNHRVRFEFASPTVRTGVWISLFSFFALCALCVWSSLRRKQRGGPS